jgi:hypothetical protein
MPAKIIIMSVLSVSALPGVHELAFHFPEGRSGMRKRVSWSFFWQRISWLSHCRVCCVATFVAWIIRQKVARKLACLQISVSNFPIIRIGNLLHRCSENVSKYFIVPCCSNMRLFSTTSQVSDRFLPKKFIIDEFLSTVYGWNFELCIISTSY